jgi:hypothetical protein
VKFIPFAEGLIKIDAIIRVCRGELADYVKREDVEYRISLYTAPDDETYSEYFETEAAMNERWNEVVEALG